ncbi:MAG: hypothetical protein GEU90_16605, partial [Gemmatimonas sp.]|nr:hypothetical protein [Gemmatimonas sp.]
MTPRLHVFRTSRLRGPLPRVLVLAVYVLGLIGSPAGEAVLLWVHLTTEHQVAHPGAGGARDVVVMAIGEGSVLEAIARGEHPVPKHPLSSFPRKRESSAGQSPEQLDSRLRGHLRWSVKGDELLRAPG